MSAKSLPKTVQKRAATEILMSTDKFSPAEVGQMFKPKKTEGVGKGPYRGPRCNTYDYEDFARGFKFRVKANNKAYNHARKILNVTLPGISTMDKKFVWMHIEPPWIMSVFEYFSRVTPDMKEYEKHVTICFDEIYVCTDCDIDLVLDMAINPDCKKCVQIMTVRSIAGGWYWPFYVRGNHAVVVEDLEESIEKFESAGLHPLGVVCDQGPSNRGLAAKIGISNYSNKATVTTTETVEVKGAKGKKKKKKKKVKGKPNPNNFVNKFEHPLDPEKPIFWIWDIVHLVKSLRNNFLTSKVKLPDGSIVSVDDLWDLLDKVRADVGSEHTSGFHLNSSHLEVEGSDLQSPAAAYAIFSERTGNALIKYFPNSPAKQALGKFIICVAKAIKILTARCRLDKKDKLKSAFRIYYEVRISKAIETGIILLILDIR